MSSSQTAPKPLQIAAAVIGNALEWYDFIVFGFFTVVIARLFFPSDSQYASLLLTTGTFGVGFFMRPVGGILLGIYADRRGRKAALLMVITLMTVAIAMIAFAPTYAAIGVGAPLIMVLARLLQGFSAGGEFASATAFLTESAPAGRRGLYGSWQMVGQGLAVLLGAILGTLLTRSLTPETLDSWGWRIPFLFGLIIGPVGLYIRRNLDETSAFLQSNRSSAGQQDSRSVLMSHVKEMLACLGMVVSGTISFYVILIYIPTFARTQLHLPLDQAFLAQSIGLACEVVLIPICGLLSDFVGRKPVMITALVLDLLVTYPLFSWVSASPSFGALLTMQIILCGLFGVFNGPISTALAEQFPTRVRSTALAIAYNIAVMLFGGFAQFFVTWLIQTTGTPIAPAYYLIFGAAVGLLAALFLKERGRDARFLVADAVEPTAA
ncbi:MAG TPA: citrate-proton symporter [Xanthobacteraceae bacterium]|jgi:MFS family permease|nr:citrate-proton symporter [Xanthobacteraceae bacterium]